MTISSLNSVAARNLFVSAAADIVTVVRIGIAVAVVVVVDVVVVAVVVTVVVVVGGGGIVSVK